MVYGKVYTSSVTSRETCVHPERYFYTKTYIELNRKVLCGPYALLYILYGDEKEKKPLERLDVNWHVKKEIRGI